MAHPPNLMQRIADYNRDRDPRFVALKYQKMGEDAFAFLRGTAHLFYEDWLGPSSHHPEREIQIAQFNQAPLVWACGDLHLENFGTYKGRDRQVYFDINDFDEAALAPCSWDLLRWLTSLWVAGQSGLDLPTSTLLELSEHFLGSYREALIAGRHSAIDLHTAQGPVLNLLQDLEDRKRQDLLEEHLDLSGDGGDRDGGDRDFPKDAQLKIDGKKRLPLDPGIQQAIQTGIANWAKALPQTDAFPSDPDFFTVLDSARRIAGNSSLGLDRYLVLVAGKGKDQRYLLDLKAQRSSVLQAYWPQQPPWPSEAHRVVELERRSQWAPPALLSSIALEIPDSAGGAYFVLRELQPSRDKIAIADLKPKAYAKMVQTQAEVTAYLQMRSAGRQGSATLDQMIAYGEDEAWSPGLIQAAQIFSQQVLQDFRAFQTARARP